MTATSPKGGRVLLPTTYQQAEQPLDAVRLRNAVANNILHAADCSARVVANWTAPKSSLVVGNPPLYRSPDTLTADTWLLIDSYGPWPLSLYESGRSYPYRVALLGAAGAGTATFGVAFAPRGVGRSILDGGTGVAGEDVLTFVPTSSTSPAWLTPATGSDMVTISDATVASSRTARATVDDTGGALVEVYSVDIEITVWVKQTSTAAVPKLYGVHIAEFVG